MSVKSPLLILLSSGMLFADEVAETYLLAENGWETPVGSRVEVKSSRVITNGKMKVITGGAWTSGKLRSVEEGEIIGERPTEDSYRLRFVKETSEYRMLYDGEQIKKKDKEALHGKTISVDRKEGVWTARVVDGDPVEEQSDELAKKLRLVAANMDFDYSVSLYGTEPRKVGETWAVDLPSLPGMGGGIVKEGKAAVFFEKTGELRGSPCAFLTLTFSVKIDFTEFEGGVVDYTGTGKVVRSLGSLWDLHHETTGRFESVQNSPEDEDGGATKVEAEGKYKMTREITILGPVNEDQ